MNESTKTLVMLAIPLRHFKDASDIPAPLRALIAELAKISAQPECPWEFEVAIFAGGNAPHARNKIVAEFMRGQGRYLFFIDSDELPEPADVFRILNHRQHVCGGLYVTRSELCNYVMNPYRESKADEATGLMPVAELGTGFKCYHRSVFERLEKLEPTLGYIEDDDGSTSWGFFCMGVVRHDGKARFLTEDYWMDQLCRKHGIMVYADTRTRVRHRDQDRYDEKTGKFITGRTYPLDDEWPDLPTPQAPMVPPPLAEQFESVETPGKLVLALQFWEGDKVRAMELARFIADIEPVYRDDVEFFFIKRFDTTFDAETMEYVSRKFLVHCRDTAPHENPGYPQSANAMSYETMNAARFWTDVKAVLLFEYDFIPVAGDWLNRLIVEWGRAAGQGKMVLGSWRPANNPLGHINGNMLFDPRLASTVDLGLKAPRMAWDIFYPKVFQPVWMRTGLIANRHREEGVSDERLMMPECGSSRPVAIHGVKDASAWDYARRMIS